MTQPTTMCPNCKIALLADTTICSDCGEDLAPLMRLQLAAHVLYNEGLRLAKSGNLDGAILKLREAVSAAPDEPSAYVVLGKLHAQKGDWAEARQWWEKTLERWPDEGEARRGLAALDAKETAARAQAQAESGRRQRRRQIGLALSFGIGGLLVAFVAVALGAFRSPPAATPAASPTVVATSTRPPPTATLAPSPTPVPPTASPTAQPLPTPVPTPDIATPLLAAIQSDSELAGLSIRVRQAGRAVWLEGDVPSVAVKYQLEALAKSVPGVELVDVSGLRVVYTVQPGDTLWQIAGAMYGRAPLWAAIADGNQLPNPRLIVPGQPLVIPPPK